MNNRPNSMMMKKNDPRRQTLMETINSPAAKRKDLRDGDDRPLSVLLNPGAQMMNLHQQQNSSPTIQKASPPPSVVQSPREKPRSGSLSEKKPGANIPRESREGRRNSRDSRDAPSPKKEPVSNAPAPQSMQDAMVQFAQAKSAAQKQIKHNMSASARLINAMADVTVCLLTRAMNEGMIDKIELRIYKKPIPLSGGGYAVGEYRNAAEKKERAKDPKGKDAASDKGGSDSEFIVLSAGELLVGDAGKDRDNVENWIKFFDVVKGWALWWRYCMAVHKRVGWGMKLERSMLNVVDSRVLGFVTIKFSNYV